MPRRRRARRRARRRVRGIKRPRVERERKHQTTEVPVFTLATGSKFLFITAATSSAALKDYFFPSARACSHFSLIPAGPGLHSDRADVSPSFGRFFRHRESLHANRGEDAKISFRPIHRKPNNYGTNTEVYDDRSILIVDPEARRIHRNSKRGILPYADSMGIASTLRIDHTHCGV